MEAKKVIVDYNVLKMEKENIVMQYIASWGWFISSLIMLASAFILYGSAHSSVYGSVLFIVFLIGFGITQYFSYSRRRKLGVW